MFAENVIPGILLDMLQVGIRRSTILYQHLDHLLERLFVLLLELP